VANKTYKDHLIVSRPIHNEDDPQWCLFVSISWSVDGNFHTHSLKTRKTFETEEEATDEGLRFGELWVDNKL
jgi:hypothetical protein